MTSIHNALRRTQDTLRILNALSDEQRSAVLRESADALERSQDVILAANKHDLSRMNPDDPKYDRLLLTEKRIAQIARDMRQVASLPSPLGYVLEERTLANGLFLQKVSVPLGVIGIIYEARPNVTLDAFALCFKAGNACVLKGGSDAQTSNEAIVQVIHTVLQAHAIPEEAVYLMPPDREATAELLSAVGLVDVLIPRGSQGLIDFVRAHARVPVIETGAGIVHTYFDISGDVEKGKQIIFNAKTRRVSVCNALDTVLIHRACLPNLAVLVEMLATKNVEIYADEEAHAYLVGRYPEHLLFRAEPQHYGTEFLDYKMSIKTVDSLDSALEHIRHYSSRHSEAIIAEDKSTCEKFLQCVDAAVVYANASTGFTDGAQFGMGAEIGISTQKLHARGPMALHEITSYKWLVRGNGQIRTN
ncbi:MAG: glutamate-5-semialdehyde dehydrogenase [Bacteroidota bacterium]|nr:glutamate-5-semialdehyde dehydrogenase [Candidatus Kapabacteria bacterium]MDW8219019.1 glutamate-5-semialdehyde dehydrogenase [Bacteroidota bacterium]